MDFVCKLYGNTYAVHVTVALVGVATLNLALPAPLLLPVKTLSRGGRKRLPKFKFSAKFPIGLHVILQIQIKKFENDCYIYYVKSYFKRKSVEVQR